jgi:hypothetical protein
VSGGQAVESHINARQTLNRLMGLRAAYQCRVLQGCRRDWIADSAIIHRISKTEKP